MPMRGSRRGQPYSLSSASRFEESGSVRATRVLALNASSAAAVRQDAERRECAPRTPVRCSTLSSPAARGGRSGGSIHSSLHPHPASTAARLDRNAVEKCQTAILNKALKEREEKIPSPRALASTRHSTSKKTARPSSKQGSANAEQHAAEAAPHPKPRERAAVIPRVKGPPSPAFLRAHGQSNDTAVLPTLLSTAPVEDLTERDRYVLF